VKGKPVIPRPRATEDAEEAVRHYIDADAAQAALGFIAALEQAYARLAVHPAIGSPRYAHELGLPGLRCWPLARFPYLVFYAERAEYIDVWRVLHSRQDIPEWMQEPDTQG
jgi:toxin ParE1/3/4